jgi:RNA polymerase sigma factor (sigma-70 family)
MERPTPSNDVLTFLTRVGRHAAARAGLSATDAEDFCQSLLVDQLEHDFAVLRRFEGRSTLRTYLTVVITRMALDWRRKEHGRYRPSRAAARGGRGSMMLERMLLQGCSLSESIETIRREPDAPSEQTLQRMAAEMPRRVPRIVVSDDCLRDRGTFADPGEELGRRAARRRVRRTLAWALRQLPPDDRRLIALRYRHQHSVSTIAAMGNLDAKGLYRRYGRILQTLRGSFEAAGLTPTEFRQSVSDYDPRQPWHA